MITQKVQCITSFCCWYWPLPDFRIRFCWALSHVESTFQIYIRYIYLHKIFLKTWPPLCPFIFLPMFSCADKEYSSVTSDNHTSQIYIRYIYLHKIFLKTWPPLCPFIWCFSCRYFPVLTRNILQSLLTNKGDYSTFPASVNQIFWGSFNYTLHSLFLIIHG